MEKRWNIIAAADEQKIKALSAELNNLDLTLTNILIQRGVDTFDKAKSFFRPSLNELHDPFLIKDMDKAVERLKAAVDKGEKILIYGDYDVDGTTSVALVYSFLKNIHNQLDYYIPNRYTEGYGISIQGIDYAKENDISLIIALDCGIKAIDKVAYANELDIDFIICDHHNPGPEIPDAAAVLDPKRKDCSYPFKELSGCGVGYKLMNAYAIKYDLGYDNLLDKLDYLAVSIAADIVPIVGENRILAYYGLKKFNQFPQLAFNAMLQTAGLKEKTGITKNPSPLTITDLVFKIAPKINAAGRMKSGKEAVDLLLAKNVEDAMNSSTLINDYNIDRKVEDQKITSEVLSIIANDKKLLKQKTTVLYHKDWHKGVLGIVASRCIETYYRPTIILTESNGKASGSARSVKGFNIYEALEQCEDLLEQFGGHKYAAGMSLKIENIPAFQKRFEEVVSNSIPEELLTPEILIDSELPLNSINEKFYGVLKQLAPFGPGNMTPVFLSSNLKVEGNARLLKDKHLSFYVVDANDPQFKFKTIGFNLKDKYDIINRGNTFKMTYCIDTNYWNGKTTLQLRIKDIKAMEN